MSVHSASHIKVEVCINCASVEAVRQAVGAAYEGGADRVELCSHMAVDGLTPEPEHMHAARRAFGERKGMLVMIRPRAGDFCYTPAEVETMLRQIKAAADARADGVVLGALQGRRLASKTLRLLVQAAHDRSLAVTFHRAFDALGDPAQAMEELIDLGVARVLTSGTAWGSQGTVLDGVAQIERLIQQAGKRMEIVLGGGLRPENVAEVLRRLPVAEGLVSVHAYSGVQQAGRTEAARVAQLVQRANAEQRVR